MTILLIRHGRPTADLLTRLKGGEFERWVRSYDEAGLDPRLPAPEALRRLLPEDRTIMSSPAKRALESVEELGGSTRLILADAAEASLPSRLICPIRLRPATCTVIVRLLWWFGFAKAKEDKAAVLSRARRLTRQLCDLSHERGHVALVGHGYMNHLVAGELRGLGWSRCAAQRLGYWSFSQWQRDDHHEIASVRTAGISNAPATGATTRRTG